MPPTHDAIARQLEKRHGKLIVDVGRELREQCDETSMRNLAKVARKEGADAYVQWQDAQAKGFFREFLRTNKDDVTNVFGVKACTLRKWVSHAADRRIPSKRIDRLRAMAIQRGYGAHFMQGAADAEILQHVRFAGEVACVARQLEFAAFTYEPEPGGLERCRAAIAVLTNEQFLELVNLDARGLVEEDASGVRLHAGIRLAHSVADDKLDRLAHDVLQETNPAPHSRSLCQCGFKFFSACREWSGPLFAWLAVRRSADREPSA